jgi:hypothetical protein
MECGNWENFSVHKARRGNNNERALFATVIPRPGQVVYVSCWSMCKCGSRNAVHQIDCGSGCAKSYSLENGQKLQILITIAFPS